MGKPTGRNERELMSKSFRSSIRRWTNPPLADALTIQFAAGVNAPATADHCPIMGVGADAAWGAASATE